MALGKIIKYAAIGKSEHGFPGIFLFLDSDFDNEDVDEIFIYYNEDILISS